MNDDNILRQRHKALARAAPGIPYSAKDFQLEVLDGLAEMRSFCRGFGRVVEQEAAGGEGTEAGKVRRPCADRNGGTCIVYYRVRHSGCSEHGQSRFGTGGDESARAATGADRDNEYGGEDTDGSSFGRTARWTVMRSRLCFRRMTMLAGRRERGSNSSSSGDRESGEISRGHL